jgi:sulfate transport system ATP-binding protein
VMNEGRIEQQGAPDEVYDHPASPFVLQFLGDVNLFHGRLGHAPGGAQAHDVSYVRPHELSIQRDAETDTWPVTLSQSLTVGPNTRIEFKREDGSYVDVELPRSEWQQLRQQLDLQPGSRVYLKPRRITRFADTLQDPAAMI